MRQRKHTKFAPIIQAAGPGVLVFDSFTDDDNTPLESHAIAPVNKLGASWTRQAGAAGALKIVSNDLAWYDNAYYTIETSLANVKLSLAVSALSTSRQVGIIARFQDINNFWRATIHGGVLKIVEMTGGVTTIRASAAIDLGSYTIIFTLNGDTLAATAGAVSIDYTSSEHQDQTKHGLIWTGGAEGNEDDFKVFNP